MNTLIWSRRLALISFLLSLNLQSRGADTATNASPRRTDANGNPIRRAPTGHVSNYDESKVGTYTLPDPLALQNGKPVKDAETWLKERRPEILELYRTDIYGRVPERTPKLRFHVAETTNALDGKAILKELVGELGTEADAPKVHVHLYMPPNSSKPVPVMLHLVFFGGIPPAATSNTTAPTPRFVETGPIDDILARGFGYATVRYTEFEGDSATNSLSRVRKLALAPGQSQPAADEWGTISAWAWGASRVIDYFETDPSIDAKRIAIIGHSRLGKTVLWIGAQDPRVSIVFSSCSGEMGAALGRRDFGETIDDMASNFPWQFAGNFQKYAGHWSEMPVDAHLLIALNAPHPVFVTGGTQDQWADPRGEFLAEVAAGPVYRLLGKKDLGTTEFPKPDAPIVTGDLAFNYHTGGHTITATEWKEFLDFAGRHWKENQQP